VASEYQPQHLAGAKLVFAATDVPEVNSAVVQEARRIGALVCRADVDEDEAADFSTPAKVSVGRIIVTVSAGSPALSALVRTRLEERFDPRFAALADVLHELRPRILRSGASPSQRRQWLVALASDEAADIVD